MLVDKQPHNYSATLMIARIIVSLAYGHKMMLLLQRTKIPQRTLLPSGTQSDQLHVFEFQI